MSVPSFIAMPNKASTTLSICIVGGGIGGLTVAILLAQCGHDVVILEQRDADYEGQSTGGVSLSYNSTRVFEQMGLKDELVRIADQGFPTRMKYDTLDILAVVKQPQPFFMVHRADVTKILTERALEVGVAVRFKARIASILEEQDKVIVKLKDDTTIASDILIGADGIESVVRRTIFPDVTLHVDSTAVLLLHIPKSDMDADPGTASLYNTSPFHTLWGPGLSIVSWSMTRRQVYHLQLCDYEYGTGEPYSIHDPPDAPYITAVNAKDEVFLEAFRKRWSIFHSSIQHICNSATSFTKWKIAELPPLPRYSSSSHRIVLLGDAAHAIKPFAGQGANMAIEDGAALSTLLSQVTSRREIPDAVSLYDQLRVPRLARLRAIIESNVKLFALKTSEEEERRSKKLSQDGESEEAKRTRKEQVALQTANYAWIVEYDVETEAQKAWTDFQSNKPIEARI